MAATPSCGSTMQAATTMLAQLPTVRVISEAASGSIAALDR